MAFTKLTTNVEHVQALPDRPNSNDGLTSDQVKAVFDQAGTDIKTYINDVLTPELDSNSGLNLGIINVMSYFASGSDTTTTGGVTIGLKTLTVASASSFSVGQGISIAGAGAAGALLVTIIAAINGLVITLVSAASTTVVAAEVKHDDTAALQAVADLVQSGDVVTIPIGTYNITTRILFDTIRDFTINCYGVIQAYNCSGIKFLSCRGVDGVIRVQSSAVDWSLDYSGVTFEQTYYCSDLAIKDVIGFQKGVVLSSSALTMEGTAYNHFKMGNIRNNKYQVYINASNSGFVTENSFYNGRYANDSDVKSANSGGYGVYMVNTSSNSINDIRFYSPCFESLHNGTLFSAYACTIISPRFEDVNDNHISGNLFQSTLIAGYGGTNAFDTSKIKLDRQSRNNNWLGKFGTSESTVTIETVFGGFGARNYEGDNAMLGLMKHDRALNCWYNTDESGLTQRFNKAYEGSAIPTTGTFRANAVVWNTNTAAGQVMFWVSNGQGTMGTLVGITATGLIGATTVTVNSATGLYTGAKIAIAGGIAFTTIANISGLTITLENALTAGVTGAAMSFFAATWRASPLYT